MKPQKSSKKINVIVVVLVLLIGILIGGYLVLHSNFSVATVAEQISKILEQDKQPVNGCQPNSDDKNKDSDNDGLMDWQEVTWKTNPCVPDTDKDGYLDGEEVSSGYSPTIKAPNDALPDQGTSSPRGLPLNLTQALAQILGGRITNGQMGNITDPLSLSAINTSNQVIDAAIQEIATNSSQEFSLPYISDEEIIISSDNSTKAIKSYARKISEILDSQTVKKYGSESEAIYFSIQNNDFTEIKEYVEFYKKASQEIKQVPVPSILKEIHKEQIGIFQTISNIHQAISNIQKDPLRTSIAIEQYKTMVNLTFEMSRKTIDILSSQ